jgi:two-component system response regulator DesR
MIVDDSDLVSGTLERVLRGQSDLEVVAIAASESEALDQASGTEPDVVIMDYRLGGADGIDVAGRLRALRPGTQVLILTGENAGPLLQERADAAGCAGVLSKTSGIHGTLAETIRRAHAEGRASPPSSEGA